MSLFGKTFESLVKNKRSYSEATIFPVLTAQALLEGKAHQRVLEKLKTIVALPNNYYEALYEKLIHHYVEFVQVLPEENYGELGSLLNRGLGTAFHLCEQYKKNNPQNANHLVLYVLFSASLLKLIACVNNNRRINLCTQEGHYIDAWNPYRGSLVDKKADFYKIRHLSELPNDAEQYLTVLLARQLMPEDGFCWIAEREDMLRVWIGLLSGQEEMAKRFQREFVIAQKYAKELFNFKGYPITAEMIKSGELDDIEAFLKWLKESMAKGETPINTKEADVHVVDGGLFVAIDALLDKYEKKKGKKTDRKKMHKQFDQTGLSQDKLSKGEVQKLKVIGKGMANLLGGKASQQGPHAKVEPSKAQGVKQGVLISNPRALLDKVGAVPSKSRYVLGAVLKSLKLAALPALKAQTAARQAPTNAPSGK